MNKLKCPRCENKELKRNENYCPICGLNLKERTAQEVAIQEQSEHLHKLSIIGEDVIKLDDFQLKGVCKYTLSKSVETEISTLDLRIIINNSKTVF
ncbi:hypothetical protein QYB28_000581 [Clostridium perfringens]